LCNLITSLENDLKRTYYLKARACPSTGIISQSEDKSLWFSIPADYRCFAHRVYYEDNTFPDSNRGAQELEQPNELKQLRLNTQKQFW